MCGNSLPEIQTVSPIDKWRVAPGAKVVPPHVTESSLGSGFPAERTPATKPTPRTQNVIFEDFRVLMISRIHDIRSGAVFPWFQALSHMSAWRNAIADSIRHFPTTPSNRRRSFAIILGSIDGVRSVKRA